MFIAISKIRGVESIIGSWNKLCDLDKRVWKISPYLTPEQKPLAKFWMNESPESLWPTIKIIWDHQDLSGVYVGRED